MEKASGNLIVMIATRMPGLEGGGEEGLARYVAFKKRLVDGVVKGQLKSNAQMEAAFAYYVKFGTHQDLKEEEFAAATGIGVIVTREEIDATVAKVLQANAADLAEKRYRVNVGLLMKPVREAHPWADMKDVKAALDAGIAEKLGPKTEADLAPPVKAKKGGAGDKAKKAPKAPKAPKADPSDPAAVAAEAAAAIGIPKSPLPPFPSPEENNRRNKPEVLEAHLKATGGKIVCRFPPEPNGYSHVGHAKAISLDFGLAKARGGVCILRFDDTNPTTEKTEYVDSIQDAVKWLGFEPVRVTFSSDYFDDMFNLAIKLIKSDGAYVCHQTREESSASREAGTASPWRDRPIEESLRIFYEMRDGLWKEGSATLRMKMPMDRWENACMRDSVAYRIKFDHHHRSGDKWCIYPSYDYTHCIVDSLENVTHSLCTLEFAIRQESYYWLLEKLGLYQPVVWEFARLNISHTMMSKRRLLKLVNEGIVTGWDDPRLPTISGLRKRGYTASALNLLCDIVGVTRNDGTIIPYSFMEHVLRLDLDVRAERRFAVMNPLKITITNWGDRGVEMIKVANHPKRPELGTREMPMSGVVYVDKSDWRDEDAPDFYGLAPGKKVMLKYSYVITVTKVTDDGLEAEVVSFEKPFEKVKGVIHWVAEPAPGKAPATAEVRSYKNLFTHEAPASLGDRWMAAVEPNSMSTVTAYVEPALTTAAPESKYQFERVGFFSIDPSGPGLIHRAVELKESKAASAIKGDKKGGKKGAAPAAPQGTNLSRVEVRVGLVKEVTKHPEAETLFVEKIDLGEAGVRTICSGLVGKVEAEALLGAKVVVVTNLKPANLRGVESAGMVMCADHDGKSNLLLAPEGAAVGEVITWAGNEGVKDDVLPPKKWAKVASSLKVSPDGVALAGEPAVPWMTSAGPVKVSGDLRDCKIK